MFCGSWWPSGLSGSVLGLLSFPPGFSLFIFLFYAFRDFPPQFYVLILWVFYFCNHIFGLWGIFFSLNCYFHIACSSCCMGVLSSWISKYIRELSLYSELTPLPSVSGFLFVSLFWSFFACCWSSSYAWWSLIIFNKELPLWLVWLSGVRAGLWTQRSLVPLPVRTHAWVVGQVPGGGRMRGNHTLMFLSLSFSLSSPL